MPHSCRNLFYGLSDSACILRRGQSGRGLRRITLVNGWPSPDGFNDLAASQVDFDDDATIVRFANDFKVELVFWFEAFGNRHEGRPSSLRSAVTRHRKSKPSHAPFVAAHAPNSIPNSIQPLYRVDGVHDAGRALHCEQLIAIDVVLVKRLANKSKKSSEITGSMEVIYSHKLLQRKSVRPITIIEEAAIGTENRAISIQLLASLV